MIPDMDTLEQLALEHRQQLLREAEHTSHTQQRFAGKLRIFLYTTETV